MLNSQLQGYAKLDGKETVPTSPDQLKHQVGGSQGTQVGAG